MISKNLILSTIISIVNTIINYYLYQDYYIINKDDNKLIKIFCSTFISSFIIMYIYEYYSNDTVSINKMLIQIKHLF